MIEFYSDDKKTHGNDLVSGTLSRNRVRDDNIIYSGLA